jgi:formylglycine-generating enzyme required for sulfatase activity
MARAGKLQAGTEQTLTLTGKSGQPVPMTFCYIPAGDFWMGSRDGSDAERPRHRVHIAQPFWLGQTPVTLEQFQCFREDHQNNFSGDLPQHPVVEVNWQDAIDFCKWLTRRHMAGEGKKTKSRPWHGCRATLPTEAQWEYACRGPTGSSLVEMEYCSGDGVDALQPVGWFDESSGENLHAVKQKAANPWGLHDMHGLVWEWCLDLWNEEAYVNRPLLRAERSTLSAAELGPPRLSNVNEPGPANSALRGLRGGSWNDSAAVCRSAIRFWLRAGGANRVNGFRVAVLPGP